MSPEERRFYKRVPLYKKILIVLGCFVGFVILSYALSLKTDSGGSSDNHQTGLVISNKFVVSSKVVSIPLQKYSTTVSAGITNYGSQTYNNVSIVVSVTTSVTGQTDTLRVTGVTLDANRTASIYQIFDTKANFEKVVSVYAVDGFGHSISLQEPSTSKEKGAESLNGGQFGGLFVLGLVLTVFAIWLCVKSESAHKKRIAEYRGQRQAHAQQVKVQEAQAQGQAFAAGVAEYMANAQVMATAKEETPQNNYSFCEYCGAKVFDTDKSCDGCGARVKE